MCHLEDNAGLFQKILRGYGTADHTAGEKQQRAESEEGKGTNTNKIILQSRWNVMETDTRTFIYSYSLLQKDLYVFPKATGIIVPHSFGIPKRLQQRSCLKYLPRI